MSNIFSLSEYRKIVQARAFRAGRTINPMRERHIRDQARNVLVRAWKTAREHRQIEIADILPIEPRWIAGWLFTDWRFEEPPEIGTATSSGRKVAGLLDRATKKIEVASNLPHQIRRFTGAHEIGHLVLHPRLQLLRESPLSGDNLENRHTPPEEQEANIFGAELLMPTNIVRESFGRIFGPLVDGASINEDRAFYCTSGEIRASELQRLPPVELAMIIAEASPFTTSNSRSLCDIFGVSKIAMAIQLVDLGLVINLRGMGQRL